MLLQEESATAQSAASPAADGESASKTTYNAREAAAFIRHELQFFRAQQQKQNVNRQLPPVSIDHSGEICTISFRLPRGCNVGSLLSSMLPLLEKSRPARNVAAAEGQKAIELYSASIKKDKEWELAFVLNDESGSFVIEGSNYHSISFYKDGNVMRHELEALVAAYKGVWIEGNISFRLPRYGGGDFSMGGQPAGGVASDVGHPGSGDGGGSGIRKLESLGVTIFDQNPVEAKERNWDSLAG